MDENMSIRPSSLKEVNLVNWGEALKWMQEGSCVAREEWTKRERSQYLFIMQGMHFKKVLAQHIGSNNLQITDQIWIVTSKGTVGPYGGCNCDTLAEDWVLLQ